MSSGNNIPDLRFPEFTGEWTDKKLGDIGKSLIGLTYSPDNVVDNGGTLVLRSSNIKDNQLVFLDNVYVDGEIAEKNFVKEGDILICARNGSRRLIGKSAYIDKSCEGAAFGAFMTIFRSESGQFIFQLLQSDKFFQQVQEHLGATINQITTKSLNSFKFKFPTQPEQQKIASFLTAVDKKIAQLQRKKELLEQYKKGVMQQIFSQQLRFKDEQGNDYPDWEVKTLGEIAKVYDGTHMTPNYVKAGIPFYSVEQLTKNDFSNTKYISKEVFEKENKRVRLEKGDILMTRIGNIGTSVHLTWDVTASFYVSLALIKKSDLFNSEYLNQYIKSDYFQKELYKRTIHAAFPIKINLGDIGKCNVQLPVIEEQSKIALLLGGISNSIDNIHTKIGHFQNFKKGLLQQMFI